MKKSSWVIAVATSLIAGLSYLSGKGSALSGRIQNRLSSTVGASTCQLVNSGFGPAGTTSIHTEAVVTGLNTPWDIAFLPGGTDWLVTERHGALRLVRNHQLLSQPVMTLNTVDVGEGGLLGIALDPDFSSNRLFYVYYTALMTSGNVNRVQKFRLSSDHQSAVSDQIILDNIPSYIIHDGGRIKFGPDGSLYISTGEGDDSSVSRNGKSVNGKILRVSRDGKIPADNPEPGQPWFVKGLRNPEAFDWLDSNTLVIADNGPTGEYQGRVGGDELDIANKGDDLGWPSTWHCETQSGLVTPILSWVDAMPPGGLLVYRGNDIPTWKGDVLIASLGGEQLHRVKLNNDGSVKYHEAYLKAEPPTGLGRLRSVIQGPNGELYVTTSNCDGRGTCPNIQDGIYRIT